MKKSNYHQVFYIVSIVFLLTSIFLFFRLQSSSAETSQLQARIDRHRIDSANYEEERRANTYGVRFQGLEANSGVLFDDPKISMEQFLQQQQSPKLVLRFSHLSCDVCIDTALHILKRAETGFHEEDVTLMLTYNNVQDLRQFERVNQVRFPSVLIPAIHPLSPADELNLPYFFVLLPGNRNLRHIFFPVKENPARTREYLRVIREKYFKN